MSERELDLATQFRIHMADGWNSASWYLLFGWVPPVKILEVVLTRTGRRVEDLGEYYPQVTALVL